MAKRATKRGDERTDLSGSRDVLICGASFAGLMAARQLAGSGADVLVIDRYEIGERQTSACAIPTAWLEELGLIESEKQRFDSVLIHTAHGSIRLPVPWSFSTFDYPTFCEMLWEQCDAEFETAKVNGKADADGRAEVSRRAETNGDGAHHIGTDRGIISSPLVVDSLGWKRVLAGGAHYQPPDAPLSRGLEVHPPGGNVDLEVFINRRYVPAGYGWSFPADDEVRVGVGSFDPYFPVRPTTDLLADDIEVGKSAYQGNWIPHKLRPATADGIFFAGDSAGHCFPLTAEGIRPALYFGAALGMQLREVVEGKATRDQALADYHDFSAGHQWAFDWLLRAQKLLPKIHPRLVKPTLAASFRTAGSGDYAFNKYLNIAPPEFATLATRALVAGRPPVATA
ncbi:MAG: NAD(P)/FAD-dependent oxidoreductase [Solirubrobacterales bacterium]|nr:NAD(P)/FAD-dependent oxidoreductase [Solirubrobacterales bacterium]